MKTYLYIFTVEGDSAFPIDMLRYDRCTPNTEQDSGAIAVALVPEGMTVKVELQHKASGPWAPTVGRWESFGWRVLEVKRQEIRS